METPRIEEQGTPQPFEETVNADTACGCDNCDPAEADQLLRNIWQKQLVKREDRVLHGHFEGELARKLAPIHEVYNS
jgi:hypothetical protein